MKTTSLFLVDLIVWFLVLGNVLSNEYTTFNKLVLPPNVTGPASAALDRGGKGPYVAVADGRILKWQGPTTGFLDFAYTSPNKLCYFVLISLATHFSFTYVADNCMINIIYSKCAPMSS